MSNKVMLYPVTTDGQVKMSGGKSLKDSLGSAGGIATLDANGKLSASQIPNSISGTNASFKRYLSTSTTINNPDTHGIYLIPAPSDLRASLSYDTNDEQNLSFGSYAWNLYAPTSDEEVFFTNDFDIEAPATIIVRDVAGVQTYFAQVNGGAVDFLQYLSTLLTTSNGYPTFVHLDSAERQISIPNEELHLYLQFQQTNWEVYIFIQNALKCIYSTNTETIAATLSNLQQQLENIGSFGFSTSIVDVLPTENISTSTIYLKRNILKADAYLAFNGAIIPASSFNESNEFQGIQFVSDITMVQNPQSGIYYLVDSGSSFESYVVQPDTGELAFVDLQGELGLAVVQSVAEIDPNVSIPTIYFVIKETEDYYREYLYVDQRWEIIGSTQLQATQSISWIRASNTSEGYVANPEATSWPGSAVDTLVYVNFDEAPRPIVYEYDQEDWVPSSNRSINAYVYEVSDDVLKYRADSNILLLYDGKLYGTLEGTLLDLLGAINIESVQASYTKNPGQLWLDTTPTDGSIAQKLSYPQFIDSLLQNDDSQSNELEECTVSILTNSTLTPGQQYKITDYQYIKQPESTSSSDPQSPESMPNPGFDIIVTAKSENDIQTKAIAVPKNTNPIQADCSKWDLQVELQSSSTGSIKYMYSYDEDWRQGTQYRITDYNLLPQGFDRQYKYCIRTGTSSLLFIFEDGYDEEYNPYDFVEEEDEPVDLLYVFNNFKYVIARYYVTATEMRSLLSAEALEGVRVQAPKNLAITYLRDEFGNSAFYDFKSPTDEINVPSGSIVYDDQIFAQISSSWKGMYQYPFNGSAANGWIWRVTTVYECISESAYIVKTEANKYFYLLNPAVTDGYMSIFPGTVKVVQPSLSDYEIQSSDITFTSEAQTLYVYTFTSPNLTDLSLTGKVTNVTIDEYSQHIIFEAEQLRNIRVTDSINCTLKGTTIENLWVNEATYLTEDVSGTTPRMIPDDLVHESDLEDLSADVDTMPWRDSGHSLGYEIDDIEDQVYQVTSDIEQITSDIEDVNSDIETINNQLEKTLPVFYDADTYLIPIQTYHTTSDGTQKTEFISIDITGWDVDSFVFEFMDFGSVGGWNIGSDVDMDVDGVYFTGRYLKEVSNHSIVTQWDLNSDDFESSEFAAYVANLTSIKVSLYRSTPPDGLYIMTYGEIGYWDGTTTTNITRSIEFSRSYPYFDGPDELRDFFKPIDSSEPFALVDGGEFVRYQNAAYDDDDFLDDLETMQEEGYTGWYQVSKNKETHVYLYTNGKAVDLLGQSSSSGATAITVDSAFSTTSENPVQNKVIQAALDTKVDAVTGKVLSTNDFTDSYKTKLDGLDTALNNKVDIVSGKGLSTEDYTTAEKNKLSGIAANANNYTLPAATANTLGGIKVGTNLAIDSSTGVLSGNYSTASSSTDGLMSATDKSKLDGIETGATAITVDSSISSSSTNPVENQAVYTALAGKVDTETGKGLSTNDYTDVEKTKLDGIEAGANNYSLPAATTNALGGVKVGSNLAVDANGVISGNYSNATTSAAGLMSADDKTKLAGIATGAQVNTIETIQVNGTALTPDANKVVNIVISGNGESSGSGTVSTPVNTVEPVTTFPSASAENIGKVILYVGSDSRFYGETFICTVDGAEPDNSETYQRIYGSNGDDYSLSTIYTNSGIPCYKALYYENDNGDLIHHLDDGTEITFGHGCTADLTYWRNINDRAVDGHNDESGYMGSIYVTDITDGSDAVYNDIYQLGFRNELDLMVKGVTIQFTTISNFTVFLPHEFTYDDGEEITVQTPAHPARIVGAETLECQADCEYLLTIKARNGINFFEMKKLTTPTEVTNNIEVGE